MSDGDIVAGMDLAAGEVWSNRLFLVIDLAYINL